jgi:hypothetical protein
MKIRKFDPFFIFSSLAREGSYDHQLLVGCII